MDTSCFFILYSSYFVPNLKARPQAEHFAYACQSNWRKRKKLNRSFVSKVLVTNQRLEIGDHCIFDWLKILSKWCNWFKHFLFFLQVCFLFPGTKNHKQHSPNWHQVENYRQGWLKSGFTTRVRFSFKKRKRHCDIVKNTFTFVYSFLCIFLWFMWKPMCFSNKIQYLLVPLIKYNGFRQ